MASTEVTRQELGAAAIVGLGITETGRVYGRTAAEFAADAVRLAAADAALTLADVDGLLVSGGLSGGVDIRLARMLGLENLGVLSQIRPAPRPAPRSSRPPWRSPAGWRRPWPSSTPPTEAGRPHRRRLPPGARPHATGFCRSRRRRGPRNPNSGAPRRPAP
jgi:hypothetical protein